MAKRDEIVKFLNKELKIKKIKDSSRNGLQTKGKKEVLKIGFAVDACLEVFEKAKKENCSMIIVHHGLFWKKEKKPEYVLKKRLRYLKKNEISLYAAHLPLDLHNKYGNNIELAEILKLENIKKFGHYHGISIGFSGRFKKKISASKIKQILDKILKTKCIILPSGKKIKTIGIISGYGITGIGEAITKRLDCFLTGETDHTSYHFAKEAKINIIFAGHYATETLGVKALMPVLEKKFGVKTVFVDAPSGM